MLLEMLIKLVSDSHISIYMLTVKYWQTDRYYTAQIRGPKGVIEIRDLVWVVDRQDILEIYYWESWAVLNGSYHCCFSIPGKVLLIEQEPGSDVR